LQAGEKFMFTQFRIRYPKGSLVTELVTIDRGKYIVRCWVQNEGTTLATGLAAADTVELAEDQARTRALEALALDSSTVTKQQETPAVTNGEVLVSPQPTPITARAFPEATSVTTPTRSESLVQPQPMRVPETTIASDARSLSSLEPKREEVAERVTVTPLLADEMTFTYDEYDLPEVETTQEAETPLWAAEKTSTTPLNDVPVPSYAEKELETDTNETPSTASPVDFSDIIARTNVELKRLGWTNQQGRDYLVQTYGKRSRQLLTDDELLDFLHHLESEPSPQD
jgi:hypothetical protein